MTHSLTVVEIINILVKPLQYRVMQHKVKRQVLLLLGELDCYVVHKRSRIRHELMWNIEFIVVCSIFF